VIRWNVHIYPTAFRHESRILRITGSLAGAQVFDRFEVYAMWDEGLPVEEFIDAKRSVWRMRSRIPRKMGLIAKMLRFCEWTVRGVMRSRNRQLACVNPHSVSALPMAVCLKLLKRCHLVYDTHELETETVEAHGVRKLLGKIVERALIPFADKVVVTTDGYAEWYRSHYKLTNVVTIKNYPLRADRSISSNRTLRDDCNLKPNDILFVYQGLIARARGIELLLDVFSRLEPKKHIVFLGFGKLLPLVEEYAAKCSNIHFRPGVKPLEVVAYISSADVGVSLIEHACLSYYHTLPNKVLECLSAGVPVIVSNFPDMGALVTKFDCGWKVPVERSSLFNLISTLDRDLIDQKKIQARAWAAGHCWEGEAETLLKMYQELSAAGCKALRDRG
jgi:glycosyltransferase involved in cell wall biosynthesis